MNIRSLITGATVALAIAASGVHAAHHEGEHAAETRDIVEIAAGNKDFSTLVTALKAAGLVDTLQGAGPFTVFAPTNAAFAALPAGTLDNLLKPENKQQLIAILTYHVVPGAVKAADVVTVDSAKTVQGGSVKVTANETGVRIDDANVVATDIVAANGVIHVIDKVILPQS